MRNGHWPGQWEITNSNWPGHWEITNSITQIYVLQSLEQEIVRYWWFVIT